MTWSPLLAHLTGDYVIQTSWMADRKTEEPLAAAAHALTYTACFLPLTRSPRALAVIAGTHYAIDHWRLARHLCWAKNQASPQAWRYPWSSAVRTGYPPNQPDWLAVWLMIIADNTVHLAINDFALEHL